MILPGIFNIAHSKERGGRDSSSFSGSRNCIRIVSTSTTAGTLSRDGEPEIIKYTIAATMVALVSKSACKAVKRLARKYVHIEIRVHNRQQTPQFLIHDVWWGSLALEPVCKSARYAKADSVSVRKKCPKG